MLRTTLLLALSLSLVLLPGVASAEIDPTSDGCAGNPDYVAACGCPTGFWGVTVVVAGEEGPWVCFF